MTVRILHFTDVHFGAQEDRLIELATAYAHDHAHDLIVVSGDLTQTGRPREFMKAQAWLERLPRPLVTCAGNHDTTYYNLALRCLKPWGRFRHWIGPIEGQEHRSPGLAVRTVNTARGIQMRRNWAKGSARLRDFRAAGKALEASSPGDLRVVVCHHPLMEVLGEPITGDVTRGKAAAAILAQHRVDLVLGGHFHHPFASILPVGDERTHCAGASTLSVRKRGVPQGFNVIEADESSIRISALDFVGDALVEGRRWSLPRRRPFEPLVERHEERVAVTPEGKEAVDPTLHEVPVDS